MSRPTYMTIDLDAVRHNLHRVRELSNNKSIIAMVKANAYGHGMVRIAQALTSADALGVASLDEALSLRVAGISQPIILMEGLFYSDELAEAVKHNLTIIVHHEPQLLMLEKAVLDHPISVWLKINTGMHRLGIAPEQLNSFYARLEKCAAVKKPIGLMTHFAEADNQDSSATSKQIELFNQLTKNFNNPRSLANSAGIIAWPAAQSDWVRPGLMLYGASPFKNKTGLDYNLKPVMTLSSRIIAIVPVKKGGSVGYGGTWTAPTDTLIGVVGVGYGDGYPQFAQNNTPVLVNNHECPLVGRVSMDMLTVNLQDESNARIGDPVILWGNGLPVERIAACSNTSPYELLTRMTARPTVNIK